MALFNKRIGPAFLKENSDAIHFISEMEELQKRADGEILKRIEKQRYGHVYFT